MEVELKLEGRNLKKTNINTASIHFALALQTIIESLFSESVNIHIKINRIDENFAIVKFSTDKKHEAKLIEAVKYLTEILKFKVEMVKKSVLN
jgi:hypothetical protein